MDKICKITELFLKKYSLDKPELTYVVAFSGGFDSMCLLSVLKNISKNRIVAIHLNHKWRGAESDMEEQNCCEFCAKLGVDFYSESLGEDVPHTETAAREARYEFFNRCAEKFNSRVIFTAHNKNDNVETLIYRVCKGTGVRGLSGISEKRGIFYRPLLSVSRQEIEDYCKNFGLKPNNDSSNSDTKYKRNYIRSEVLPVLAEVNPNVCEMISSLIEVASEETEIVQEYVGSVISRISKDNKISTSEFFKLSECVQKRVIYQLFINNNLDYDRKKILCIWEFLRENSSSKSGMKTSLTDNLWIFVNDKFIEIISTQVQNSKVVVINCEGLYEFGDYVFDIAKYSEPVERFPKDSENFAYINLKDFPLQLRCRQNGDIIKPFGLGGTQKLKKYLNEKKLPNHEKDTLPLLAQGQEILWVSGFGLSDKIKVVDNPTHIIRLIKKK